MLRSTLTRVWKYINDSTTAKGYNIELSWGTVNGIEMVSRLREKVIKVV